MNLTLLNGRYRAEDARKLLTDLISVKIAFHEGQIKTGQYTDEDVMHSEKRIQQLEADLQKRLPNFPKGMTVSSCERPLR